MTLSTATKEVGDEETVGEIDGALLRVDGREDEGESEGELEKLLGICAYSRPQASTTSPAGLGMSRLGTQNGDSVVVRTGAVGRAMGV